jgi:hypothetical protein
MDDGKKFVGKKHKRDEMIAESSTPTSNRGSMELTPIKTSPVRKRAKVVYVFCFCFDFILLYNYYFSIV